jgi:hypothetical protein
MTSRAALTAVVLLVALGAGSAAAQVPDRLEAIPLYPGAVAAPDLESVEALKGRLLREEFGSLALVSRTVKVFMVPQTRAQFASGDLVSFYVTRLAAKRLGRSGVVPVDPPGKAYYVAEPEGVLFTWYVKGADGDVTRLSVSISPGADDGQEGSRFPVALVSERYAPAARVEIKAPGEKELGLPVYPGSTFVPTESSENAIGSVFVFVTGDPVQQIVSFFEKATQTKAGRGEPSPGRVSYWFQRAPGPLYDVDHVVLEPGEDGTGAAKTKISYTVRAK